MNGFFCAILVLPFQLDLSVQQTISDSPGNVFRYVCLTDAGCFDCRGSLCNAGESFDSEGACRSSCSSAEKIANVAAIKSGAICSDSTCLPCRDSACDLATFYPTMKHCEEKCTSLPAKDINYECQRSGQCVSCKVGMDCPGDGEGGGPFPDVLTCLANCSVPRRQNRDKKYRCLSSGKCEKCTVNKNCPQDIALYDTKADCKEQCKKTQFFCLPGGRGCRACGGASNVTCSEGDNLYEDSRSCGNKCKSKYYCADVKNSTCAQCSSGLDCPEGTTYNKAAKCKLSCKRVTKDVFYCEYAGKCKKCRVGIDCPDILGLYDREDTCKAVCKSRSAAERQYFCDMTLQQCRECTAQCPAVTFKTAAECKSAECPTTAKGGLWTCTGTGVCSPCKLSTGCGVGLGPDGKEITDVCQYLPDCLESSVFNSKYSCEKECFRKLCDNLPSLIYENRTESIEYDYWYYWNYCLPARPLLKQEYCTKPQVHKALKFIPDQLKYEVGDYVQIECQVPYKLDGSALVQCFTGGIWWPKPYCKHNVNP